MMTRSRLIYLLAGLWPLASTSCIVVGMSGWSGPTVWTTGTTEQLPINVANLKALEVRTHNGSISFDGQPAGTTEAFVLVTMKAGGLKQSDAAAALEAIDVYVEPAGSGTQRIGWKWRIRKRPTWKAKVSFEIMAPGNLRFNGETHNGAVTVKGAASDVRVVTHNGRVDVQSRGGKLYAETHNGKIVADYAGADIALVTHNGSVMADLNRCAALSGSITTHNGAIEVVLGEDASAHLTCRTHNGAIRCNVPLSDSEFSRRKLTGRIGTGEGSLDVTTHNGSVRIKKTG